MADDRYDRDGNRIVDRATWYEKLGDMEYRRVAETTLANGTWVSTVWVGMNMQYGEGPPLIFETMVFPSKDHMSELDVDHYSTEDEALEGHAAMVKRWSRPAWVRWLQDHNWWRW